MPDKILITGASGLLGQALVRTFSAAGFRVLAQYRRQPLAVSDAVKPLCGDFSSLVGVRNFLKRNRKLLRDCGYLVHAFGPLTTKDTARVRAEDFVKAFYLNLVVAAEITRDLLAHAGLRAAVYIGFEFAGAVRPYRQVLGYAMAKNALLLLTKSYARTFPRSRFNMVSFPNLKGAVRPRAGGRSVTAEAVSAHILSTIAGRRSGMHFRIRP